MPQWTTAWIAAVMALALGQAPARDTVQAQYQEAMAHAVSGGLAGLVLELHKLAAAHPSSPFTPLVLETIQMAGLLHPGLVKDADSRMQALKSAGGGDPTAAGTARRLDLLKQYYAAALRGRPDEGAAGLSEASLEASPWLLLARADAALRSGDHAQAGSLARQVIESDPYSPLLASAYVILGFCDFERGNAPSGARHFQRAISTSPLPTVYGRTQDLLATAYRFGRPVKGSVGDLFDGVTALRMAGIQGLKDPRALLAHDGSFLLIDRDQVLTLTAEGKVTDAKPARNLEDMAIAGPGRIYRVSEDFADLAGSAPVKLTYMGGGKARALGSLRSIVADPSGDFFVLDKDAGIFRGTAAAGPSGSVSPISPARGQLLRADRRGRLYVLTGEQRSIMILSRDGKQLGSIATVPIAGKKQAIEYFALDVLGHVYVLDSGTGSIQVFAVREGGAGLETAPKGTITFEATPAYKNLRVLAVAPGGEVAVTGKNEDNWIIYR